MDTPYRVGSDVAVLPSHLDVPGVGTLLVNSFVLLAEQPVLVDTGLAVDDDDFLAAVGSIIDPAELRWIWVTHDDADHTGNLQRIMEAAPQAKLVTHALGALRMTTWFPLALDRVHAIVPGDRLDLGDRVLVARVPPTFDNPTSTGFVDESTSSLFAVDSFGAILPGAVQDVGELAEEELVGGMVGWATFDAPWLHLVDRSALERVLDDVRALNADRLFVAHLPATSGRIDQFLKVLSTVPDAERFVPPDAAAFGQIAAALQGGAS